MDSISDPAAVYGAAVSGVDGRPLGVAEQVYLDVDSGKPTWALVNGPGLGDHRPLVPLDRATLVDSGVLVPFTVADLRAAPIRDTGRAVSPDDEQALHSYYDGLAGLAERGTAGDTVIRSEERLHVGVRSAELGRARVRKYVTTETVTQIVPVSHEEIVVHRQPVTAADAATLSPTGALSEEVHDIVLHGQRVVTSKETVPVERVTLGTRTVTEQETVTAEVSKENIVFESTAVHDRSPSEKRSSR